MAGARKTVKPTYDRNNHRSVFSCYALARERPRLPCVKGAVSAQLTEGLFYRSINILANALEISTNFVIGNSNNGKAVAF